MENLTAKRMELRFELRYEESGALLGDASGKELTCQCRRYNRCGFNP